MEVEGLAENPNKETKVTFTLNPDSIAGLTKVDIICPNMGKIYAHLTSSTGRHPGSNISVIRKEYDEYMAKVAKGGYD